MNWANRLTVSRLGLTILFVLALNSEWRFGYTAALVLFVVAGVTDFFDGEIARRYHYVTNFGKLMDPLVDKIMMAAAFISLVPLKAIPAWAATIVVARDFELLPHATRASPPSAIPEPMRNWRRFARVPAMSPAPARTS